MEIIGREGRLSLNRPFTAVDDNRHLLFYNKDNQVEEIPVPEQELYIGEVEDMHAAILDGAPPYVTLQETRDHVRTILSLYKSAHLGKPVRL